MTSITVAIPFYYKSPLNDLRNCLLSINDQTIKPNEIIITINGYKKQGAIDKIKFEQFIKAIIKDIQVKVYFLEKPSVALALNKCIRESKFCWICRIDADDKMLPNRIELFYKYLSNFKSNHSWVIYSQVKTLEKGKIGGIWKTCHPRFLGFQLSLKNPIHHVSVFFKKEIIIDLGGYRDFKKVEDYDLWLRVYKYSRKVKNKNAFARINKPLVAYSIDLKKAKETLSFKSIDKKTLYQKNNLNLMPYWIVTLLLCLPVNIFSKIRHLLRPYSYKIFNFVNNNCF